MQHLKRVAGAVADGEHDVIGRNALAVFEHDATHPARAVVGDIDIRHLGLEAILAAQRFDPRAKAFHHRHQPERTDVGLGDDRGSRAARRP